MDIIKRHNVTISGSGEQVMVFVHGFGCDQRMWRLVAPAFEDQYRVVLLDLVGAGRSDLSAYDPARYASLEAHAQDVVQVLEALDAREVILVGHSVSAMIGALATIAAPERFAALVMVAPSPYYLNEAGYSGGFEPADIDELLAAMDTNYLGWSGEMAPVIMGHNDRPELAGELYQSFCATDPRIARHFARATFLSDHRADMARVPTPTLVLQVTHDALVPVAVGAFLQHQLPESQLVLLDTFGHCPHLSAPHPTTDAIRHYLRQRQL
ncbi:alpha/beta fold hydrolase [Hymenobacter rubripertinctus]|uniref:Alpha/beta hydrolase n=1 Tax=Hymenobacter rubripertinctus TaxID=2029981 RepID=A0A418QNB3_9BACT|nr:alpha/beta hydrolase [Hymenobacter rubripertinctus]RIY06644.1 alpha/beta hydrolase [Hymenobacter rubripertinctus]